MAENTKIEWAHHTFNPWWGCTRVAPGCDNCYAAALDKRIGGDHWNVKTAPRLTSESNWKKPIKWNNANVIRGTRERVFCGSMMDWCDKDAPAGALERLWQLIVATPNLDWLLLTKRAPRIKECLPDDWGKGYSNVWLGVTVEDIKHGLARIRHLQKIPARFHFISAEPLLENPVGIDLRGIEWAIIGGESGPGHRPIEEQWVDTIFSECIYRYVPVFFKQWGGARPNSNGCEYRGRQIKEFPIYSGYK